jgi:hypothetical protein
MGAYTFEAAVDDKGSGQGHKHHHFERGAPEANSNASFRLTGLSKLPIVHDDWYSGPWLDAPMLASVVDYVVYPTSILIEGDNVFVTVGIQDIETWLVRLSLREILDGMITIAMNGECL